MSHASIIKRLGGPTALARTLGIAEKIPLHWGARGIPSAYWHRIEKLPVAAEQGITAQALEDTRPPRALAGPRPGAASEPQATA